MAGKCQHQQQAHDVEASRTGRGRIYQQSLINFDVMHMVLKLSAGPGCTVLIWS